MEKMKKKRAMQLVWQACFNGFINRQESRLSYWLTNMMHLYWIVIVTQLYKDNYEPRCVNSSVLSKPKGNTFVSCFWRVSANSARWAYSVSWITCRISVWVMIIVLFAVLQNVNCGVRCNRILRGLLKPTMRHMKKPASIWNGNMTVIILVRTVKIFTIRSVFSMLFLKGTIKVSGSLPARLLSWLRCCSEWTSISISWRRWKWKMRTLIKRRRLSPIRFLYFIRAVIWLLKDMNLFSVHTR